MLEVLRADLDFSRRMQQRYRVLMVRALVVVFGFDEQAACIGVQEVLGRFPEQLFKEWLVHQRALKLAAGIAKVPTNSLNDEKFASGRAQYYAEAERLLDAARKDYEATKKPAEAEVRIRERAHRLWRQEGGRGNPEDHWHRAKAELAAETAALVAARRSPRRPPEGSRKTH